MEQVIIDKTKILDKTHCKVRLKILKHIVRSSLGDRIESEKISNINLFSNLRIGKKEISNAIAILFDWPCCAQDW